MPYHWLPCAFFVQVYELLRRYSLRHTLRMINHHILRIMLSQCAHYSCFESTALRFPLRCIHPEHLLLLKLPVEFEKIFKNGFIQLFRNWQMARSMTFGKLNSDFSVWEFSRVRTFSKIIIFQNPYLIRFVQIIGIWWAKSEFQMCSFLRTNRNTL